MRIEPAALEELKQICAGTFHRSLSDAEAHDIGQRIIRFLMNFEGRPSPPVRDVDME
jgi:hypothetical protein